MDHHTDDQRGNLVVISAGPLHGQRLPVAGDDLLVGRHPSADIRLEDPSVSRFHARLHVEPDRVLIRDLGSTGGTFVDGTPVTGSGVAIAGSTITFASVATRFDAPAPAEPGLPPPPSGAEAVPAVGGAGGEPPDPTDPGHGSKPGATPSSVPKWLAISGAIVAIAAAIVGGFVGLYPILHKTDDGEVAAYRELVLATCQRAGGSPTYDLGLPVGFSAGGPLYDKADFLTRMQVRRDFLASEYDALNQHAVPERLRAEHERATTLQAENLALVDQVIADLGSALPDGGVGVSQIEAAAGPSGTALRTSATQLDDAMTALAGKSCKVSGP